MTLEFTIHEEDFLNFQLFTTSHNKRIQKRKKLVWIVTPIVTGIATVLALVSKNFGIAIYFGLIAITCLLFYPKYFNWRYKKHYKTYIKENYAKRFGQTAVLEFRENTIYSKDLTGEGTLNVSQIEQVNETGDYFFIKISTGLSLILPKKAMKNLAELNAVREKLLALKIPLVEELDWKW